MVDRDHDPGQRRTLRQNAAMHLMFNMLADELNTHGFDMKRTLKADIDIPWTGDTVKSFLWKPVQKAQLSKESTTQLTTKEIDAVYDTLNRYLGEKLGIHVDFPSIESLINKN